MTTADFNRKSIRITGRFRGNFDLDEYRAADCRQFKAIFSDHRF
jgi:hypothetical protein